MVGSIEFDDAGEIGIDSDEHELGLDGWQQPSRLVAATNLVIRSMLSTYQYR